MDTTIRNLDQASYRKIKARAALQGRSVGEVINDAIRSYLARPDGVSRTGSLLDLLPEAYPDGCDRLSEEVDAIVYGA